MCFSVDSTQKLLPNVYYWESVYYIKFQKYVSDNKSTKYIWNYGVW